MLNRKYLLLGSAIILFTGCSTEKEQVEVTPTILFEKVKEADQGYLCLISQYID